jgi:primosomal protein N' (replication factor Y)
MRFRRVFHYPPYSRMAQLVVRGRDRGRTAGRADDLARLLQAHPLARETRVSGPAPAPLERLQGYWRFQILLRHSSAGKLRRMIGESLADTERTDLVIDIDPQDLF